MASQPHICPMPTDVKEDFRKFTFKNSRASKPQAIVYTVDTATKNWILVSKHEPVTMEELAEELEGNQPRFVLLIYPYKKGDIFASPVIAIHYIPKNTSPETKMLVTLAKEQFDGAVKPQITVPLNEEDIEDGLLTDEEQWQKRIAGL